jgi:serpin B
MIQATGNDFATKFNRLITSIPGNAFSSPYSVRVALGMCSAGAVGETSKVLSQVLVAPGTTDEQNDAFGKLVKEVNGDGQPREYDLTTANALWSDKTYKCNEKYVAAIDRYYGGALNGVDFAGNPTQAIAIINQWVSVKTGDKINNLVNANSVNRDTRLVLTNAIYFKGKWQLEFKKEVTEAKPFMISKNESVQAPMMSQKSHFSYYEDDTIQALDMRYKGGDLSMLVVLPQQVDGLAKVEEAWTEDHYNMVVSHLHSQDVQVYMPKFKLETTYELKPLLFSMGLGICFSDAADFSGMGEEPLKISEVVHKALVEVDEEGTVAAAATGVTFLKCAAVMPSRPKVFNADHPFMFFIRNRNTGTILFAGHLKNPTA